LNNELKWIIIASVMSLVLIAGMVTAGNEIDKIRKLKELNANKLCEKEIELNMTKKQCKGSENKTKIDNNHPLQFELNTETEVIHIWSK